KMKTDTLNENQLESEMASLKEWGGWRIEKGELTKEFHFATYLEGVRFAVFVAEYAEKMNHHPDLTLLWRRVLFRAKTHRVDGLTKLDFELAKHIEEHSQIKVGQPPDATSIQSVA
ncbi:MAG: 4a-hydroxytetrahydrobiopterin dehydratase, partial [Prosthecobacter sp.]